MRHPSSQRFHDLLKELGELHDRKQADYGLPHDPFYNVRSTEDWGAPAWVGAMIRASDKMRRLQTLARVGALANEPAEDSFKDIAVHTIIGLVLYQEQYARHQATCVPIHDIAKELRESHKATPGADGWDGYPSAR